MLRFIVFQSGLLECTDAHRKKCIIENEHISNVDRVYTMTSRWVLGSISLLLSIFIYLNYRITYQLFSDKIVYKSYFSSKTLYINVTTICYELVPTTNKTGIDKYDNSFYIKTKEPSKQFKIYDRGWQNYIDFKNETEKVVEATVNKKEEWQKTLSSKQKRLFHRNFEERVKEAKEEDTERATKVFNNVMIGFGLMLFLIGLVNLLNTFFSQSGTMTRSISSEPFLMVVGLCFIIRFTVFQETETK